MFVTALAGMVCQPAANASETSSNLKRITRATGPTEQLRIPLDGTTGVVEAVDSSGTACNTFMPDDGMFEIKVCNFSDKAQPVTLFDSVGGIQQYGAINGSNGQAQGILVNAAGQAIKPDGTVILDAAGQPVVPANAVVPGDQWIEDEMFVPALLNMSPGTRLYPNVYIKGDCINYQTFLNHYAHIGLHLEWMEIENISDTTTYPNTSTAHENLSVAKAQSSITECDVRKCTPVKTSRYLDKYANNGTNQTLRIPLGWVMDQKSGVCFTIPANACLKFTFFAPRKYRQYA